MKYVIAFLSLIIFYVQLYSQTDSVIGHQTIMLKLVGNPPYPRVNQPYTVCLDLSALKDSLYRAYVRQYPLESVIPYFLNEKISLFSMDSLSKGKHEIAPLHFTYNNFLYATDKHVFHVDDSLQLTNEGLWIRHILTSDTTFCLTIEQRVPLNKRENESELQLYQRNSDACQNMVQFKPNAIDFNLLEYSSSENSCSIQYHIINTKKQFYFSYFNNVCFVIKNKNVPIVLSKEKFMNIPATSHFDPITIK